MPKKPRRHNRPNRDPRTVQSAASLLRRIGQKAGGALPAAQTTVAAASHIQTVRELLPEELRQHLLAVLEKPGELVLFTDSAVWAGRLKLAAAELSGFAAGRRQVVRLMPRGGYRK